MKTTHEDGRPRDPQDLIIELEGRLQALDHVAELVLNKPRECEFSPENALACGVMYFRDDMLAVRDAICAYRYDREAAS